MVGHGRKDTLIMGKVDVIRGAIHKLTIACGKENQANRTT